MALQTLCFSMDELPFGVEIPHCWLLGRYLGREHAEVVVCLCWCQCSHGARVALVDNTFPSLGLLKCGVSVHPREIARGSREAALG